MGVATPYVANRTLSLLRHAVDQAERFPLGLRFVLPASVIERGAL